MKVIFATVCRINSAAMIILLWDDERYSGFKVTDTEKCVSEKLVGFGVELDIKVRRNSTWAGVKGDLEDSNIIHLSIQKKLSVCQALGS